jgi:hypothetical protein
MKVCQTLNLGNKPLSKKRPAYAASAFAITCKVAEDNAEWTAGRIAARQRWVASQSTSIWRIDQLS